MATSYMHLLHKRAEQANRRKLNEDEDPMETIRKRLEEVQHMVVRNKKRNSVVRDNITIHSDGTHSTRRHGKNDKRKSVHAYDCLRHSTRIALLIRNGFIGRKKYFIEDNFDEPTPTNKIKEIVSDNINDLHNHSSIGWDTQLCLRTMPHFRSTKQIQRIIWLLRATKAFSHLFSPEMENEVARYVAYEIYDADRLLSYQGRPPERLYFIIAGKMKFIRQIPLASGEVTKEVGGMTKGMTSNVEQFENQVPREYMMVSSGQLEVLILYIEDFFYLQRTSEGPPIEWIRTLDLFHEFPCDKFENNPDVIDFKFYPKDKVITDDTNRTPWLYIVKTGEVKVVRLQTVVDMSNDWSLESQSTGELGCGKSYSHAESMLGILAKQKKFKTLSRVVLPKIDKPERKKKRRRIKSVDSPIQLTKSPRVSAKLSEDTESIACSDSDALSIQSDNNNTKELSDDVPVSPTTPDVWKKPTSPVEKIKHRGHGGSSDSKRSFLPSISIAHQEPDNEDSNSRLFLTREKTKLSSDGTFVKTKERPTRMAHLQLDVLKAGDIFGVDHLKKARFSENVGLTLISDGAEVICISKRFFLQNAVNNTMLKVETMFKEYLSVEEAKSVVHTKETWGKYKTTLYQQVQRAPKSPRGSVFASIR